MCVLRYSTLTASTLRLRQNSAIAPRMAALFSSASKKSTFNAPSRLRMNDATWRNSALVATTPLDTDATTLPLRLIGFGTLHTSFRC